MCVFGNDISALPPPPPPFFDIIYQAIVYILPRFTDLLGSNLGIAFQEQ